MNKKSVAEKDTAYSTFEDLEVHKTTLHFRAEVYPLVKGAFEKMILRWLTPLKRATISISNKTSEGFERQTDI